MADQLDRLKEALSGRYRIERELGSGGMATVYLAHDLKHERRVAVKVFRPELAAALGTERFFREIKITANLSHPHIVPLLDSGEADGFLYYVMPLVEGDSLRSRLNREKQLALIEAVTITSQVASALAYAHSHDIVHRDIKPENILLEEGQAVVTDFGVARAITAAGGAQLTETGIALGTPLYMSPEQALGEAQLDGRSDIYSLGCVLYEMLAGEPPHTGPTPQAILARKCVEPVPELRPAREAVPVAARRVLRKALGSAPCDRFATADQFATALNKAYAGSAVPAPVSLWHLLRSRAGLALIVLLLGALGVGTWFVARSARTRWAMGEALPEIQRLVDRHDFVAAYRLARRAEPYLAQNPEFQRLWRESTCPLSVHTTPLGAQVYMTDYRTPEGEWDLLGTSPIDDTRVPMGLLRFRVEKGAYTTLEAARSAWGNPLFEFTIHPSDERPEMIRVAPPWNPGVPAPPPPELEAFWLDRYEVTNRDFREFVEGGGYGERKFWTHPIVLEGRVVPWERGITAFVDRTGRPGPSTWELGSFPEGQDDFPVSGLSWYEAAAYCEYAGKQLPTVYHWYQAAGIAGFSTILALSNLSGQEPAAVGAYHGIAPLGHYDMAGNVREWVLNPIAEQRYILGGAWSDPGYAFTLAYAAPPDDRSPKNGVRCASYAEERADILGAELEVYAVAQEREPVDDAVFRLYRGFYSYEKTPLNPEVESVEETARWRQETVSMDAPYGSDRIPVHLFLPKTGDPPYQAVVYYPGMYAFETESSRDMETRWFDFIVRTGRAVVHPVYEATFERRATSAACAPLECSGLVLRERVIHWAIDISRSIDYLETRSDIDATKLAFYGFSWGAWNGPIFTAIETRFKASILLSGGLWAERDDPAVEPVNFAPRATVPVLMVSGRDDFWFPYEGSQRPLFHLLGAPDGDKRHVALEGGHNPEDWQGVVREVLDWLDRYLGPVR